MKVWNREVFLNADQLPVKYESVEQGGSFLLGWVFGMTVSSDDSTVLH